MLKYNNVDVNVQSIVRLVGHVISDNVRSKISYHRISIRERKRSCTKLGSKSIAGVRR